MEDDGIDKSEWNDRDRLSAFFFCIFISTSFNNLNKFWFLENARERGLDPMDPAAYGDAPV